MLCIIYCKNKRQWDSNINKKWQILLAVRVVVHHNIDAESVKICLYFSTSAFKMLLANIQEKLTLCLKSQRQTYRAAWLVELSSTIVCIWFSMRWGIHTERMCMLAMMYIHVPVYSSLFICAWATPFAYHARVLQLSTIAKLSTRTRVERFVGILFFEVYRDTYYTEKLGNRKLIFFKKQLSNMKFFYQICVFCCSICFNHIARC